MELPPLAIESLPRWLTNEAGNRATPVPGPAAAPPPLPTPQPFKEPSHKSMVLDLTEEDVEEDSVDSEPLELDRPLKQHEEPIFMTPPSINNLMRPAPTEPIYERFDPAWSLPKSRNLPVLLGIVLLLLAIAIFALAALPGDNLKDFSKRFLMQ
jgi:hypothetical protein